MARQIHIPLWDFSSAGRENVPCVGGFWEFDNDEDVTEFTGTAIAAGTFAKVAALPSGVFRVSGAATTASSGYQIQLESTPVRLDREFSLAVVETRIRLNDLKEQVWFGLSDVNAALLTSITDAIGIKKAATAAGAWTLQIARTTGNAQNITLPKLINDTNYHHLTLIVERGEVDGALGNAKVKVEVDGRVYYEGDITVSIPYDDNLAPSLAILSGDNVSTQTADVDYLRYKSTRSLT